MRNYDVYIFELGVNRNIPGIVKGFPGFIFPFWGDFYLIDFIIASFYGLTKNYVFYVNQNEYRTALSLINRWKGIKIDINLSQNILENFLNQLNNSSSENIFLVSTSQIAFIDVMNYVDNLLSIDKSIIKIAIDDTPIDIYLCKRQWLVKNIKKNKRFFKQEKDNCEILFNDILLTNMETIENVPGNLFFHNSLSQFFESNRALSERPDIYDFDYIFSQLSNLVTISSESLITREGSVKDSYISGGVTIKGNIVNSVIFRNVTIERDVKIINSVIMNGNVIDIHSTIENSLVMPYLKEIKPGYSNIGKNVHIGNIRSDIKNKDYPSQIKGGMTVLGMDSDIPDGFAAEGGCYISPRIELQKLRDIRGLKRGNSLKNDI